MYLYTLQVLFAVVVAGHYQQYSDIAILDISTIQSLVISQISTVYVPDNRYVIFKGNKFHCFYHGFLLP